MGCQCTKEKEESNVNLETGLPPAKVEKLEIIEVNKEINKL